MNVLEPPGTASAAGFSELYRLVRNRLRSPLAADSFAGGSLWSLAVNGAGTGVSLLVQIFLTNTLGQSQYGTYVYVLAWMNLAAWAARVDLDACASRFVAAYAATNRPELARGFIRRSHQIVWALAIGLALLGALGLWIARPVLPPGMFDAGLAACGLMIPTAVILHTAACLQGLKQVVASQTPILVVRPLLLGLVMVAAVLFTTSPLTAAHGLLANLVATAVATVFTWRALRASTRRLVAPAAPAYETRLWLRTAIGFVFVSLAQLVLSAQVDLLVVGSLVSTDEAGIYGIASQLAAFVAFGANAVAVIGAPTIAELHAAGRRPQLQRFTALFGLANLGLALPVALVLVLAGKPILGLFGPAFTGGYLTLLILAAGHLVGGAVGTQAGYLLTMTGHERLAGRSVALSAGLNLALAFALTPIYGVLGTAAATAIAQLARCVLFVMHVRRTLGIRVLAAPRSGAG